MAAVFNNYLRLLRLFMDNIDGSHWQVARHLCMAGHMVHIVSSISEFVFRRDISSSKLYIRNVKAHPIVAIILCLGNMLKNILIIISVRVSMDMLEFA